jgi:hypothetical protein
MTFRDTRCSVRMLALESPERASFPATILVGLSCRKGWIAHVYRKLSCR